MIRGAILFLVCALAAAQTPEVRFLCLAPSPYTQRHDALRAGLGIYLSLKSLKLPLRATFYDAVPVMEDAERGKALLRGAQVLVVGGSTWAQGSAYYLRRFFEFANLEPLTGVAATVWATAGGAHTGGELLVQDTLRTLMGMGAHVFSLGQKYMVFTTGERLAPKEGDFTLLDCWYMDQFARAIAVAALSGDTARRLNYTPFYWKNLPKDEEAIARFSELRDRLNAAADPKSEAYRNLRALIEPSGAPARK